MTAKDSLWSWVILSGVTLTFFLEIGILKALSVLLPDLQEQLVSQTWIIGSFISIMTGWGCILGLSATYLKERFGVRLCFMVTGLVSTAGIIVCAYAPNVYILFLGITLGGFIQLQENIAIGIIPDYFDKYHTIAVNIYCFGSGFAVVVYPLLVQVFRELYGWRGALLILSALTMQSIVFGGLIKRQHRPADISETAATVSTPLLKNKSQIPSLVESFLQICEINLLTSPSFICQVIVPGIANGYTFAGWIIYIVSFSISVGASRQQASLVATIGGLGLMIIRLVLPFLNSILTHRQLLYASSITMAISLGITTLFHSVPMLCIMSFIFCLGTGTLCTEIYIAARLVTGEGHYISAVSWYHFFYGFAIIAGGTTTGVIYDLSGSFSISFLLLSAVSLVTAVSLVVETIWTVLSTTKYYEMNTK